MDGHPRRSTSQKILVVCSHLFIYYLVPIFYIVMALIRWNDMTPCFRREALVNSIYCIYLRFADPSQPFFILDMAQTLAVFWVVERVNYRNSKDDLQCLYIGDSLFYYATHLIFELLLWLYTISVSCISLLLVGLLAFGILEAYWYRPQRRRRQGLSESEFNALDRIRFSLEDGQQSSDLSTCSICVRDFKEQELLIKLPNCVHIFHEECIREWFRFHSTCPNCRTDTKQPPAAGQEQFNDNAIDVSNVNAMEFSQSLEVQELS